MGLLIIGPAQFRRLKALDLLAQLHPADSHRRHGTALIRHRKQAPALAVSFKN